MCKPVVERGFILAGHLFHTKGIILVSGEHWPLQLSPHPSCMFVRITWLDRTRARLVQGTCDKIFFVVALLCKYSAHGIC